MPRNREILCVALGSAAVAAVTAALSHLLRMPAAIACVVGCACVCALALASSLRRYRSIARLSAYLQRLAHGETALDIRDNEEGELSILKNEIYKVTVALAEQADALSLDKRELARALADISHQLKTPLTAMGVMADLLDDDALSGDTRREFVGNMRHSLNRMEWLVLTLLKLARLDANAVGLKPEPIALSALARRGSRALLIPIELREQTLIVSGQDADVVCDPDWTGEAIANILKNAVERTPAGGRIAISYGCNPLYSFVSVRDGGPGIDKADMPCLFKRFHQGKNAGRDSVGIGLAMSLAVMRKQNGDIEARNAGAEDGYVSDGVAGVAGGAVFTLKFYGSVFPAPPADGSR